MSERQSGAQLLRAGLRAIASFAVALIPLLVTSVAFAAGDANLRMPDLGAVSFDVAGTQITGVQILWGGIIISVLGIAFGLLEFSRIKAMRAHPLMLDVSHLIYETCKTYLLTQGKFLIALEVLIAGAIVYYFGFMTGNSAGTVLAILLWSVIGILGSFAIAWFGIRLNTYANSRTSFASLEGKAFPVMEIPLRAGMSIGVVLICVEMILLISILLFVSPESAGACFIGFAIGESLGASVLRIAGGIFTKIADISSDLMKIVFNIKEDDARNPGVIADCAGDNAGDSVGPTADGFETFGVTATALVTFITLAVGRVVGVDGTSTLAPEFAPLQAKLIIWIFTMATLMIVNSIVAWFINRAVSRAMFGTKKIFNFEIPLTTLCWITSAFSIAMTFLFSYLLLASDGQTGPIWFRLAAIISLGTLGAAIVPEATRVFTSTGSRHVIEVVNASREGGASLNVLSGLVAGNFSAFWKGGIFGLLMLGAWQISNVPEIATVMGGYNAVFAFGLLAFGMLSMGPVTIAVDSFGPVSDNAQSVFELSQIETTKGIEADIQKNFGFKPDFEQGKELLEMNDSAGNTFKATAKPVLIGTAVIGAATLIFSLVLLLNIQLNLLDPRVLLGLIAGGMVVYWFTGASIQAVTTGSYRAVEYIKDNIKLDSMEKASVQSSKDVVRICTMYAQKGMLNIFLATFMLTLAFAFFDRHLFTSYLVSIATFGLFQALFMANAGGAWDNAKKLVEVELKAKGTELHAATVVGDTVGDPFKDTSSVALNPVIKFTTLFGILAAQIAVGLGAAALYLAGAFTIVGLFFVYRSFYGMRITEAGQGAAAASPSRATAAAKA